MRNCSAATPTARWLRAAPRRTDFAPGFLATLLLLLALLPTPAAAYTANKVWFEFRPTGIYRVYVAYTVPELKELREAYTEFRVKKDAERFYWDLVKGADFYLPVPGARRFVNQPLQPSPW